MLNLEPISQQIIDFLVFCPVYIVGVYILVRVAKPIGDCLEDVFRGAIQKPTTNQLKKTATQLKGEFQR